MSIAISELVNYCDNLLEVAKFHDYCPNGLQVAGKTDVQRIASAVTASLDTIEAAIAADADVLLVHHGYFWKGENPCLTGIKRQRLARLLAADIHLVAYHLPLDAHPELGNNARLGALLGIEAEGCLASEALVWQGRLPEPISGAELALRIGATLKREPLHIAACPRPIRRVAWCTGGAQGYVEAAALAGVDAYISGEISEQTPHLAREYGIDYIAAGHYATERYGALALGEHLAEHFGLQHQFIEIHNPA